MNKLKEFQQAQEAKYGPFAKSDECPYAPLLPNGRCMKCVRPGVGHRCGDGFLRKNDRTWAKSHAPFFIVDASWSRMVIPNQQLSLLDDPRIEWDNAAAFFSRHSRKRQWWREIHFCKYGRDHAIRISKEQNARRIEVQKVRRKAGCKYKVVQEPYLICA